MIIFRADIWTLEWPIVLSVTISVPNVQAMSTPAPAAGDNTETHRLCLTASARLGMLMSVFLTVKGAKTSVLSVPEQSITALFAKGKSFKKIFVVLMC